MFTIWSCTHQHRFEGWFASADDFARQRETHAGALPDLRRCGDRAPSVGERAGRTYRGGACRRAGRSARRSDTGAKPKRSKRCGSSSRRAITSAPGFAEEARKIHYEEVPKRSIRGQATREEAAELRDEGIDFMSLPSVLTRDSLRSTLPNSERVALCAAEADSL